MKRILILSTSLRRGSNSEVLAREFARGAKEAGNQTEFLTLTGKTVGHCIGCLACQKTQKCVIRDDAAVIIGKMRDADVLVFATPVYFYGMSGQMKTLLDRTNPIYPSDYRFRDVYVIATAADGDGSALNGTLTGVQGWLDCFEKARLAGVVRGGGINDAGEAENHPDIMKAAYEMGAKA